MNELSSLNIIQPRICVDGALPRRATPVPPSGDDDPRLAGRVARPIFPIGFAIKELRK